MAAFNHRPEFLATVLEKGRPRDGFTASQIVADPEDQALIAQQHRPRRLVVVKRSFPDDNQRAFLGGNAAPRLPAEESVGIIPLLRHIQVKALAPPRFRLGLLHGTVKALQDWG
jgi:hypothetical protein